MLKQKGGKAIVLSVLIFIFIMVIGTINVFAYGDYNSLITTERAKGNNYYYLVHYVNGSNVIDVFYSTNNPSGNYVSTSLNKFYFDIKSQYNWNASTNTWDSITVYPPSYDVLSYYSYLHANFNIINKDNNSIYFAQTDPNMTGLTVSPSSSTLLVGQTVQLAASATYDIKPSSDVTSSTTWTSSDTTKATVSSTGLVTAIAPGTVTITGTYGGFTATSTITINNPVTITGISITPSSGMLTIGGTLQLSVIASKSDGTTQDLTSTCTWTSSDPTIAAMSSTTTGAAIGIKEGTVTITVITADGKYTATSTITVSPFSGNRAILLITMVNGTEKEYDLSISDINAFLNWYDNRANGIGKAYYAVNKINNVKPFLGRREYLIFDKILDFEIKDYNG